jgi:D-sedoheptulose 7-phosphate isomerase
VQVLTHSESVGGKVIIVGNGGSAAIASHVSVDFTKAANLRSINFNEADLITCFSNDYGYENWVAQALEAYADLNDVVILISSSGKSKNMINGGKQCKDMNIPLITFTGFNSDNALRGKGDINFWVDSNQYNIVEMTHHIWLLAIVDYIINKQN